MLSASRGTEDSPVEAKDDDIQSLISEDSAARGPRLNRLMHSREEAEAIASVSSKSDLLMAVDFDANRAIANDPRVARSRVVHFATHGIFDSKNPAMSGLVFSLVDKQGNPQAGFLGLDDIYRLHLSADLVVLSACETALGEEVSGEGLVGLTWGFIYAGAKSVVASLWQVNDASTAELMRVFYTGMERHGLSAAAALREAQLTISQQPQWRSPYYWAGFVIEGEYAN
jgi:CHAT domain-containing protein